MDCIVAIRLPDRQNESHFLRTDFFRAGMVELVELSRGYLREQPELIALKFQSAELPTVQRTDLK